MGNTEAGALGIYRFIKENPGIRLLDLIQDYQREGVPLKEISSTLVGLLAHGSVDLDHARRLTIAAGPGLS